MLFVVTPGGRPRHCHVVGVVVNFPNARDTRLLKQVDVDTDDRQTNGNRMKDFRHGSKLFERSVESHGNTLFRGWNANNSMICELKMDGWHIEWMRVYCNKHWTKQYLDASFTSAVEVNDRKQFMEMTIHFFEVVDWISDCRPRCSSRN